MYTSNLTHPLISPLICPLSSPPSRSIYSPKTNDPTTPASKRAKISLPFPLIPLAAETREEDVDVLVAAVPVAEAVFVGAELGRTSVSMFSIVFKERGEGR